MDSIVPFTKGVDSNNNKISNNELHELIEEKNVIINSKLPLRKSLALLEKEIAKFKDSIFNVGINLSTGNNKIKEESNISEPKKSNIITKQDKIFLPVDKHPNFNFVGRILGPRGLTIKQFEKNLDCRIMIRGKGSTRNPKQEEQNKGQPNFEHLNEELHVLIVVSDDENNVDERLKRIRDELSKFIHEPLNIPESQDTVKQMQLMELSILNETERQQRQQALFQQQLVANNFTYPFLVPAGTTGLDATTNLLTNPISTADQLSNFYHLPPQILPSYSTENSTIFHLPEGQQQSHTTFPLINGTNNDSFHNQLISPLFNYEQFQGQFGPVRVKTDPRLHPYSRA